MRILDNLEHYFSASEPCQPQTLRESNSESFRDPKLWLRSYARCFNGATYGLNEGPTAWPGFVPKGQDPQVGKHLLYRGAQGAACRLKQCFVGREERSAILPVD